MYAESSWRGDRKGWSHQLWAQGIIAYVVRSTQKDTHSKSTLIGYAGKKRLDAVGLDRAHNLNLISHYHLQMVDHLGFLQYVYISSFTIISSLGPRARTKNSCNIQESFSLCLSSCSLFQKLNHQKHLSEIYYMLLHVFV